MRHGEQYFGGTVAPFSLKMNININMVRVLLSPDAHRPLIWAQCASLCLSGQNFIQVLNPYWRPGMILDGFFHYSLGSACPSAERNNYVQLKHYTHIIYGKLTQTLLHSCIWDHSTVNHIQMLSLVLWPFISLTNPLRRTPLKDIPCTGTSPHWRWTSNTTKKLNIMPLQKFMPILQWNKTRLSLLHYSLFGFVLCTFRCLIICSRCWRSRQLGMTIPPFTYLICFSSLWNMPEPPANKPWFFVRRQKDLPQVISGMLTAAYMHTQLTRWLYSYLESNPAHSHDTTMNCSSLWHWPIVGCCNT